MLGFKRKQKEKDDSKELEFLSKYINETRGLYWSDEEIKNELLNKGFKEDKINLAFESADNSLPLKKIERRIEKMPKEEYDEDEDFEDEDEDQEDEEEDDEESEPEKPVKKEEKRGRPKKEEKAEEEIKSIEVNKEEVEKIDNTLNQILSNHEARLQNIEASLFRLRTSV
jgi:hypothetical protein